MLSRDWKRLQLADELSECMLSGANKHEFSFSLCHCIITRIIISNDIMQSNTYTVYDKNKNRQLNENCSRQTVCSFKKNIVLYFIKFFNRVMLCLNSHMLISSDKICRLSVIINVYRRSRNHCSLPFARNDLGRDAVDVSTAIKTCLVSSTNSNKRARFV